MHQVDVIASIEQKYRDELDLYSLLHCLCKEQHQAARRGSTAEVLRLTRAKEELMAKIEGLELEIESLRAKLDLDDSAAGAGEGPCGKGPDDNVLELNPSQRSGMSRLARLRDSSAASNR